jgi:hypothetical protein
MPSGYFNGLDRQQGQRSMQLLEEEYRRFISSQDRGTPGLAGPSLAMVHAGERGISGRNEAKSPSTTSSDSSNSDEGHESDDGQADDQALQQCRELNQINQLRVFWGKRQWISRFDMYQQYDGPINLQISWWNRLLSWIWSALAPEHMTAMHNVLYRLRTNRSMLPNIHIDQNSGRVRSRYRRR